MKKLLAFLREMANNRRFSQWLEARRLLANCCLREWLANPNPNGISGAYHLDNDSYLLYCNELWRQRYEAHDDQDCGW